MQSDKLIQALQQVTEANIIDAQMFKLLSLDQLNQREGDASWSVLECIEHLNRYGDFYIPEIENKLKGFEHLAKADKFSSGPIGNYFAKSMLPGSKKMKTFKTMNPIGSKLDISVLDKFIQQQKKLLELLEKASRSDLNKIKTSISITKLIRLKLGDTFRVVIYHNQRHVEQAKRINH